MSSPSPLAALLKARTSIRQFLPNKPVSEAVILQLLEQASFSPSGGNVQPWQTLVVTGEQRNKFVEYISTRSPTGPEYAIYPSELDGRFLEQRTQCTQDMYATMGVARENRPAKLAHVQRNFTFFDAPSAVFFTLKQYMGPPQWSDVGMFMQSFMLLCQERGIATCAQEAWANHSEHVKAYFHLAADDVVFCAVAVGYADPNAKVNALRTQRVPVSVFNKL